MGLKEFKEADKAYRDGLAIDPTNELLKKGIEEVKDAAIAPGNSGVNQLFSPANLMAKLSKHPKAMAYLAQPDFAQKIQQIQAQPNLMNM